MRFHRQRQAPQAPEGIRLHFTDGTSQAVESVYVGVEDGLHVWMVTVVRKARLVERLTMDLLPARSTVVLVVDNEGIEGWS